MPENWEHFIAHEAETLCFQIYAQFLKQKFDMILKRFFGVSSLSS